MLVTAVAGLIGFGLGLGGASPTTALPDTLPLRHAVRSGLIEIGWPDLAHIEAAREFRYVAGRRFVLRGTVDVEQHAFVVSDADRMRWVRLSADRRSEVMIIHVEERGAAADSQLATGASARIARAQGTFALVPRLTP